MSSRNLTPKSPQSPGSIRYTISRAASKFLLGSSTERNASYWRAVDESSTSAPTSEDHVPQTPVGLPTPAQDNTNPWWLADDLWEDEDDDVPDYDPPAWTSSSKSADSVSVPLETFQASNSNNGDDFSAAQMVSPKALNRTVTAVSLTARDDLVLGYRGRGKGRRRRHPAALKRSGSTGNLPSGSTSPNLAATPRANPNVKPPKIHKMSVPYFTVIITLIDITMMIWEFVVGRGFAPPKLNPMLGPSGIVLIQMGGKWVPSILQQGEWWRFVSPMFLHAGLVHITLNLLSQTKMSWDLERVHGTWRVVPIYLLSGTGSFVFSAVFLPGQVTVGASGAIFGFEALLFVDLIKNWSHVKGPKMKLLMLCISSAVSLAMGLLPGVDNFAHLGGFIVGILTGVIFLPSMHLGTWTVQLRLLQVCIALPLLLGFFIGCLVPFYHGLNGTSICSWCHYIACLPIWSTCNGGSGK